MPKCIIFTKDAWSPSGKNPMAYTTCILQTFPSDFEFHRYTNFFDQFFFYLKELMRMFLVVSQLQFLPFSYQILKYSFKCWVSCHAFNGEDTDHTILKFSSGEFCWGCFTLEDCEGKIIDGLWKCWWMYGLIVSCEKAMIWSGNDSQPTGSWFEHSVHQVFSVKVSNFESLDIVFLLLFSLRFWFFFAYRAGIFLPKDQAYLFSSITLILKVSRVDHQLDHFSLEFPYQVIAEGLSFKVALVLEDYLDQQAQSVYQLD